MLPPRGARGARHVAVVVSVVACRRRRRFVVAAAAAAAEDSAVEADEEVGACSWLLERAAGIHVDVGLCVVAGRVGGRSDVGRRRACQLSAAV